MASSSTKTVVVLGGSYGGARAAQLIAAGLPDGWRVVLVDRNSHVNHVYILPRLAVLPGHEHKAFIPYDNIFNLPPSPNHTFVQAHITCLTPHTVTLSRAFPEFGIFSPELHFDYAVYALGSHLPAPLNLWHEPLGADGKPAGRSVDVQAYSGTKAEGISWLKGKQRAIEEAGSVLVVGGGALGIQFATDIAAVHPGKRVTLLHSRVRLLPRFDSAMHTEILQALESASVDVILGERLDLDSIGKNTVRTTTGRVISADLVLLCTGQRPNTELLRAMDPRVVDPGNALARVLRTMQLGLVPTPSVSVPASVPAPAPEPERVQEAGVEHAREPEPETSQDNDDLAAALAQIALLDEAPLDVLTDPADIDPSADPDAQASLAAPDTDTPLETTPYPHIFVIGDAADAFGAIPAGHNAYYQADVAARNVLRLVRRRCQSREQEEQGERDGELEGEELELERYAPGEPAIKVSLGLTKNVYQVAGVVGVAKETRDDLNAAAIWGYFGRPVGDGDEAGEMYR